MLGSARAAWLGEAARLALDGPVTWESFWNSRIANVVTWHKMGEGSGNIADSSGNGLTGTPIGTPTYGQAALVATSPETSIGFDGAADAFDLGNPALLNFTNEFTVFIPFRYGGAPGAFPTDYALIMKGDDAGFTWEWGIALQSGTTGATFIAVDDTPAGVLFTTQGSGLDDGNVHTVAMTYSNGGGDAGAFVDGVRLATGVPGGPFRPSADNVGIGCFAASTGGTRFFLGDLGHIITMNIAMSDADVLAAHNLALGI